MALQKYNGIPRFQPWEESKNGHESHMAYTLAFQSRSQCRNTYLSDVLDYNVKNVILFPGLSVQDARHYKLAFGINDVPDHTLIYFPHTQVLCCLMENGKVLEPFYGDLRFFANKPNA